MELDRSIAVDWSAANRPVEGADSIWICEADRHGAVVSLTNPPTRAEAMAALADRARAAVRVGERLIVGVDAGFGYPAGFASALTGESDWRAVWHRLADELTDDDANRSNRFEVAAALNRAIGGDDGPFWAGPPSAIGPDLTARRGPMPMRPATGAPLSEYRLVEHHLRERSRRPHSVWKLYTPGSVGSQTLLAIARLERLRREPELADHVRIWPFEVDAACLERRPLVLLVELWPELAAPDLTAHPVRDGAQVLAAAGWLTRLAAAGELEDLLLLRAVDAEQRRLARAEEGWILGAELA
ncbi:MAG: hypothetical protein AAFZ07_19910 [Actinomycetota bacterium]